MKRILFAIVALALFTACNKKDYGDANLHITGNIKGLSQGKLYIKKIVDTSFVTLDTIIIKGKSDFESHLKLDSPEMLYLILDRGQTNSVDNSLPFFAEPGEMKIEARNEEFFARAKVTGSKNQKIYDEYLKLRSRLNDQKMDLLQKNIEATKSSNVAQLDSVAKQSDILLRRRYLYTVNFALNNAKHEVGPYLALSEIPDANVKYLDTICRSMSPAVAKSKYGKLLTKYVADRKKEEAEAVK